MDIRDAIQVQYSGISGWSVTSDDDSWHPFYGGQLDGMAAGSEQTWDISVELTGNVKAGEDVINFQASSTDPDDPMGGMPYIQPYGLSESQFQQHLGIMLACQVQACVMQMCPKVPMFKIGKLEYTI